MRLAPIGCLYMPTRAISLSHCCPNGVAQAVCLFPQNEQMPLRSIVSDVSNSRSQVIQAPCQNSDKLNTGVLCVCFRKSENSNCDFWIWTYTLRFLDKREFRRTDAINMPYVVYFTTYDTSFIKQSEKLAFSTGNLFCTKKQNTSIRWQNKKLFQTVECRQVVASSQATATRRQRHTKVCSLTRLVKHVPGRQSLQNRVKANSITETLVKRKINFSNFRSSLGLVVYRTNTHKPLYNYRKVRPYRTCVYLTPKLFQSQRATFICLSQTCRYFAHNRPRIDFCFCSESTQSGAQNPAPRLKSGNDNSRYAVPEFSQPSFTLSTVNTSFNRGPRARSTFRSGTEIAWSPTRSCEEKKKSGKPFQISDFPDLRAPRSKRAEISDFTSDFRL